MQEISRNKIHTWTAFPPLEAHQIIEASALAAMSMFRTWQCFLAIFAPLMPTLPQRAGQDPFFDILLPIDFHDFRTSEGYEIQFHL